MSWFVSNVAENQVLRKYYLISMIFGGVALVFWLKWWAALIVFPLQLVYVVWIMWDQQAFTMIESEVAMWKQKRKLRRKKEE